MAALLASPLRNIQAGVAFLAVVAAVATGLYIAAGWPVWDALFMVITTVFTVGYGEIRPVDTALLRAITIGLIFCGCTGMIFVTGSLVQFITASQFHQFLGVRRMQNTIAAQRDHVIVCGYGRIGQMLARDLKEAGRVTVVVERDEQRLAMARDAGFLAMQADATDEDCLRAAGVERARVLAVVLPDDAANVFITLSARGLNRGLTIIARGEAPSTEKKLLQAGADRVVLPAHIGAERVAELILFQGMGAVLEGTLPKASLTRDLRHLGLELEILPAAAGSRCVGMTVAELEAAAGGAFLVVGINGPGGGRLQPPPSSVIVAGDGVAVLRRPGRTSAVESLFSA